MKPTTFENIRTHERFVCDNVKTDVKVIDGVEFLFVSKDATARKFLVRKDSLVKVLRNK
jgi:hypothetical protein